jgi:hypothetical protein
MSEQRPLHAIIVHALVTVIDAARFYPGQIKGALLLCLHQALRCW